MIKLSVEKYIAVFTASILIIALGIMAYISLPRESTPEVTQPWVFIQTVYAGVSPEDMENLVTRPIEEVLDGLEGIKDITSSSRQSISFITAEFTSDTSVDDALKRVKDRVDSVKPDLPKDAEDPYIEEFNSNTWPVFIVAISHPDGIDQIETQTEKLQDKLKGIPGVLDVTLDGRQEKEVAVDVDPLKLKHFDITLNDVVMALRNENTAIPGGTLKGEGQNYSLNVTGEIQDLEEFKNIVIPAGPVNVKVKDVATVRFKSADTTSLSRLNGKPALSLSMTKRAGTNLIKMISLAKEEIDDMATRFPKGTDFTYTWDDSKYVKEIILDLENNMFTGFVLVMLVTLLFLGKTNSLFVSLAIPLSMLMSFFVLQLMGITLNMVVLFSLIIALGMLVDNGIVIVENVFRHAALGKTKKQAAIDGSREVAGPIIASTITTCLAFFPIIFMPGIMGQFMSFLPKTIIVVLVSSLLVALFINPTFLARFLRITEDNMKKATEGNGRFMKIQKWYELVLKRALRTPGKVMLISVGVIFAGIALFLIRGKEPVFFPSSDPSTAIIKLETKQGTPIEKTDNMVRRIEELLPGVTMSMENYQATVGQGSSSPNKAEIRVEFESYLDREISGEEATENLKTAVNDFTGANLKFETIENGPPAGHSISYEIIGDDYAVLGEYALKMESILKNYPELKGINTDYEPSSPEISVEINRQKAAFHGLSTVQIASTIRSAITGSSAGTYRQGEDEYDIQVRMAEQYRSTLAALKNLQLVNRDGNRIPLQMVAEFKSGGNIGVIKRRDLQRTVGIWADFKPDIQNKREISAKIKEQFETIEMPENYVLATGTGLQEQQDSQAFLFQAMIIALFLIFIVLIVQFNSLLDPIIISIGVFFSIIGVLWGYAITGQAFVVIMSGIGCIALAGVAVNNCIVLVDYTNVLIKDGHSWQDAVVLAGKTRLRPVLLTAITTVLGMLPMALGVSFNIHLEGFGIQLGSEQSEFWKAFAWTMIYGLTFATTMTLIVVPSMLTLKFRFKDWSRRRKETFPENVLDEIRTAEETEEVMS